MYRHTKNLCVGTVFEEEDDRGDPCVYRITQTRAQHPEGHICYVPHFRYPDADPPTNVWETSSFDEVKE